MITTEKYGELPVRYSWNALRVTSVRLGRTMDQIFELDLTKETLDNVFQIVLISIEEGCRRDGKECPIKSVEELSDMIDDNPEILAQALQQFTNDLKSMGMSSSKKK